MKYLWIVVAIILIGGGLVAALMLKPLETSMKTASPSSDTRQTSTTPDSEESVDVTDTPSLQPGRYTDYQSDQLAAEGYNETILFFFAPWCPECRAFQEAIQASSLPDGVQVLKVDYDSSDDLKARYEVTLQSTFVSVADDGSLLSKWVGYGKDKSISAILENT